MPAAPIKKPFRRKIWMILRVLAPIDLRMAMSLVFLITIMNRVVAMPRAATRMIRVKMINRTTFCICNAKKRERCIFCQSLVKKGVPNLSSMALATRSAA